MVSVSDTGVVRVSQVLRGVAGKEVKVEAEVQCLPVEEGEVLGVMRRVVECVEGVARGERNKVGPDRIERCFSYKRVILSVDMLNNPHLLSFSKFQDRITVTEATLVTRYKLYFAESIPRHTNSFFTLKVVTSKAGRLAVGLLDKT